MVPAEGKPGAEDANQRAEQDIEAVVVELEVAGAGYVNSSADGN
jgi:hypothetical protein